MMAVLKDREKRAQKIINAQADAAGHHYAWCYWNFIVGRRAEKPPYDGLEYDKALAIRAQLINLE